jgi:alkylation response protein AidB-like acyl-CoA dehydrogenase
MTNYFAPIEEMSFVVQEIGDLEGISRLPGYAEATPDILQAILEQSAELTSEIVAPTNRVGDRKGTYVENRQVKVPDEFKEIYRHYLDGGWSGLSEHREYGGQGLPQILGVTVEEMWQSANLAFTLCPFLSKGAGRVLALHADQSMKDTYLPRLVSGEWTATMDLTEPHAGSDLAAVTTRALPEGDHYLITGQKIFITWGDHNLTDNILHLVLARLPDAPPGVKGISLFLVPKFLLDGAGGLGIRNDFYPVSVEHKLGIHGSPTCIMSFGDNGGAVGYLVGQPHQGLSYMFTLMNHARLTVGLQGVALSERAYQQARAYAKERVQGSIPGISGRVRIIQHADVRRMLMLMKAYTEAMRAMAYLATSSLDYSLSCPDPALREYHHARLDLLTPIVKTWCTESARETTSLAIQIHGGMGFIEETGVAQYYRDSRIGTIYEGTTGIQGRDFIGRKLIRDNFKSIHMLLKEMRALDRDLSGAGAEFSSIRSALNRCLDCMERSLAFVEKNHAKDAAFPGSISVDLLMQAGTVTATWLMAKSALAAGRRLAGDQGNRAFNQAKITTARFFCEHVTPLSLVYEHRILAGHETINALSEDQY